MIITLSFKISYDIAEHLSFVNDMFEYKGEEKGHEYISYLYSRCDIGKVLCAEVSRQFGEAKVNIKIKLSPRFYEIYKLFYYFWLKPDEEYQREYKYSLNPVCKNSLHKHMERKVKKLFSSDKNI